jgi:hypothetical protein
VILYWVAKNGVEEGVDFAKAQKIKNKVKDNGPQYYVEYTKTRKN